MTGTALSPGPGSLPALCQQPVLLAAAPGQRAILCHGTNEAPGGSQGSGLPLKLHMAPQSCAAAVLQLPPRAATVPGQLCLPSPCTCQLHTAAAGCPPPFLAPTPALFLASAGCQGQQPGQILNKEASRESAWFINGEQELTYRVQSRLFWATRGLRGPPRGQCNGSAGTLSLQAAGQPG